MHLELLTKDKDVEGVLLGDYSGRIEDWRDAVGYMDELVRLCKAGRGWGLAAPQAGLRMNFFVVAPGVGSKTRRQYELVVNPEWRPARHSVVRTHAEGCLSLPGRKYWVRRASIILAKWTNRRGKIREAELNGTAAIVFQHESDHLRGRLIDAFEE